MEEISCIKDGITGVCRDLKDKTARAEIETLKNTVSTLAGVDGGHLATDEDISRIESRLIKVDTDYNTGDHVYGYSVMSGSSNATQKTFNLTADRQPNSVVKRDSNGLIYTGAPTDNFHATNKSYVDSSIANAKSEAKDYTDSVIANASTGGGGLKLVKTITNSDDVYYFTPGKVYLISYYYIDPDTPSADTFLFSPHGNEAGTNLYLLTHHCNYVLINDGTSMSYISTSVSHDDGAVTINIKVYEVG